MADLVTDESRKKGGAKKARSKKKDARVDMTPMVDLGFLLITFFILTTSISKPQAMNIIVPAKDDTVENQADRNKVGDEQAFTILIGKNHRVWYYEGLFDDPNQELNPIEATWGTGEGSLRQALIEKSKERNPRYGEIATLQKQLNLGQIDKETYKKEVTDIMSYKMGIVVLVKAAPESTYDDMVNVLDELKIAHVGIYAIVDITQQEKELLKDLYKK